MSFQVISSEKLFIEKKFIEPLPKVSKYPQSVVFLGFPVF